MYNEDMKKRFVRSTITSIDTAKAYQRIFEEFEPSENEWGADLCTQSAEALQPVFDKICGVRFSSSLIIQRLLKNYVNWCINVEHYPNACDGITQIAFNGVESMKNCTVANPFHLQAYLDTLFLPESAETTDNLYRCFMWLAFSGVLETDVMDIKCSDIDLENMVINYKEMELPIYRESIPCMRNCKYLTEFRFFHPNYGEPIKRDRVDGDTMIRGITKDIKIKSIRSYVAARSKEQEERNNGRRVSYDKAWLSGVFYRAYERELIGVEPNFKSVADLKFSDSKYERSDAKYNKLRNRRAKELMFDYEKWKIAFKL